MARAVKYFIIAATNGDNDSIRALRKIYAKGLVSKVEFARVFVHIRRCC
jgi:hypothetical protein